jgi:DNA-binding NarL/FixJ family response regulator
MTSPVESREGQIRVLLADDDPLFLNSIRVLIDRQPELQVVGEAADGLQAVELAEELHPDAAVVDLHMPQLDGVTAVARLRADHPNICLIALTGDNSESLHEAVREAGADAVLLKGELIEGLVERLAGLRRSQTASGQSIPPPGTVPVWSDTASRRKR